MAASESVPPTGQKFREELAAVRAHPDVVGVSWGLPMRGGQWRDDERCVSIQVRAKRFKDTVPDGWMLPREIDGVPVDVLEVGDNIAHALDCTDEILSYGSPSTVTALVDAGQDAWALASGHGTLWQNAETLDRRYEWQSGQIPRMVRVRGTTGELYEGQIMAGACGSGFVDWAALLFKGIHGNTLDTYHFAPGSFARYERRETPLQVNEAVYMYSRLTGKRPVGRVIQVDGDVDLRLPDWGLEAYRDLYIIRPLGGGRFSRPGDSGALVVDVNDAAVGMLLGGSTAKNLSYVVSLDKLLSDGLGAQYCGRFFK